MSSDHLFVFRRQTSVLKEKEKKVARFNDYKDINTLFIFQRQAEYLEGLDYSC